MERSREQSGHNQNNRPETRLELFQTSSRCGVCNNLECRMLGEDRVVPQYRVASDFQARELEIAAYECPFCAVIVAAIKQFEPAVVRLSSSTTLISRIYMRGPAEIAPHTLSFEIYFKGARRKLELEIQAPSPTGMSQI